MRFPPGSAARQFKKNGCFTPPILFPVSVFQAISHSAAFGPPRRSWSVYAVKRVLPSEPHHERGAECQEREQCEGEHTIALDEKPEESDWRDVLRARGKSAEVRINVCRECFNRLKSVLSAQRERLHGYGDQRVRQAL